MKIQNDEVEYLIFTFNFQKKNVIF